MSIRMTLLNVLSRWFIKPRIKKFAGQSDIEALRKLFNFLDRTLTANPSLPCEAVDAGGVPALWVGHSAGFKRTILYIHGGAFVINMPRTYRLLAETLSKELSAQVLLLDYSLAPEFPAPRAADECLNAYRWLIENQGIDPANIIIGGDSAGGNLALVSLLDIKRIGLAQPSCAFMFSPVVDFSIKDVANLEGHNRETLLPAELYEMLIEKYVHNLDVTNERVSPSLGDLSGLPPLHFTLSETEIMADFIKATHTKALSGGVKSEIDVWQNTCHAHPVIKMLPESQTAINNVRKFVVRHSS